MKVGLLIEWNVDMELEYGKGTYGVEGGVDILQGAMLAAQVSTHGRVELIDMMPRLVSPVETCDSAICRAARMSTSGDVKLPHEDRGLIFYLMRNRHTTPFEMVEFKWRISMPIFVERQWVRHRTASINASSARYSDVEEQWFNPEEEGPWRGENKSNLQSSDGVVEYVVDEHEYQWKGYNNETVGGGQAEDVAFREYKERRARGISKEQSRMCLPLSTIIHWEWKMDLHNLLHFLHLRTSPHAQQEIRVYADAMLKIIEPLVPWTLEAWREWVHEAVVVPASQKKVVVEKLMNP